jgi:hypothetical protein
MGNKYNRYFIFNVIMQSHHEILSFECQALQKDMPFCGAWHFFSKMYQFLIISNHLTNRIFAFLFHDERNLVFSHLQ